MKMRLLSLAFAFCMAMGSGKASLVEPELPKQIHYIWVGGPIFQEYWDDLTTMASLTHDEGYQVNLWVDNPRHARFVREDVRLKDDWFKLAVSKYNTQMNETYSTYVDQLKWINICDVKDLRNKAPQFLSAAEHQQYWRFMDRELVGLKNFGAYSDMLRYLIVAQEGGIYLDTDSKPLVYNSQPLGAKVTFLGEVLPAGEDFMSYGSGNSMLVGLPGNKACVAAVQGCLKQYLAYEKAPHPKAENQSLPGIDAKRLLPIDGTYEEITDTDRGALTIYMTGPSLLKTCYGPSQIKLETERFLLPNFWKAKLELALGDGDPTYALRPGPLAIEVSQQSFEIYVAELMGRKYPNYNPSSRNNITNIARYLFGNDQLSRLNEEQLAIVRDLFSFVRDDVARTQFLKMGMRMLIQFKCDTSWGTKGKARPFDDSTVCLPAGEYLYKYSQTHGMQ